MGCFLVFFELSVNYRYFMHIEERKINIQQPFHRLFSVLYKKLYAQITALYSLPCFPLNQYCPTAVSPYRLVVTSPKRLYQPR